MKTLSEPYKMKFSLATNLDFELLDAVRKHDVNHAITSIFGKKRIDFLGGGRNSFVVADISWKYLAKYVDECHRMNIEFNYLLNPACLDNKELQRKYHYQIIRYFEQLKEIGVDAITINSQYLCEIIKSRFPNFKVTVGVYSMVRDLQSFRYWEDLGADEITLQDHVNRNFPFLEILLKHAKKRGTGIRLIANLICLHRCPYTVTHGTTVSHQSQKGHRSALFSLDYCVMKCNRERYSNPTKLISSEWIRPEDIRYYEDLCTRTGYENMSLKLCDRMAKTSVLERIIKAYISRSYDGNLLDILSELKPSRMKKFNISSIISGVLLNQYNPWFAAKFPLIFERPSLYIDNKGLDGFLEKFVSRYVCDIKLCADEGLDLEGSGDRFDAESDCLYCRRWAKKVLRYDPDEFRIWTDKIENYKRGFVQGKMFDYLSM